MTTTLGRGLPDPKTLMKDVIAHRGWDIRSGQEEMVLSTARGVENESVFTGVSINAPVGTGKTLGYLLGGLPSNRRMLVCTSTKALQDQIAGEELPQLAADLKELYGFNLRYGVLKGKGNYICLSKTRDFLGGKPGEDDDELFAEIAKSLEPAHKALIEEMIRVTQKAMDEQDVAMLDVGDMLAQLPSEVRSTISSSSGCQHCRARWWYDASEDDHEDGSAEYAYYGGDGEPDRKPIPLDQIIAESECAYRTAYALALASDVAVINTSLLAAEMMKSRMVWELSPQLIPGAGLIVVDEAHHLTRILTESLSAELAFKGFISTSDSLVKKIIKKVPRWEEDVQSMTSIIKRSEDEFYSMADYSGRTEHETKTKKRDLMVESLTKASGELSQILQSLNMGHVVPEDAKVVAKHISNYGSEIIEPMGVALGQLKATVTLTNRDGQETTDYVYKISFDGWDDDDERTSDHNFTATIVPVDISFWFSEISGIASKPNLIVEATEELSSTVHDGKSMILLCSGTVTEEDTVRVGMRRDFHVEVDSPFDQLRVRLCVPSDLVDPGYKNRHIWLQEAWEYAAQAIRAVGGRTLFLTTSFRAIYGDDNTDSPGFLELAQEEFGDEFQILHQRNGMTRRELIQRKKDDPTSILFATTSFWEGIDIPGEALMLTIMDKMMFPQQDDPSIEAAREYFTRLGEHSFNKVDINMVAKMMAQGDGRTQRKESDLGGTLLLDSRQANSGYGGLTSSLISGKKPYTNKIDVFCDWLEWCADNIGAEEVPVPEEGWRGLRRNIAQPRRSERRTRRTRKVSE